MLGKSGVDIWRWVGNLLENGRVPSFDKDVLVVDDNVLLLSVLSDILREQHYHVRTATDGFEALALLRAREPDVLISDLSMPRMSGYEFLSIVRRRFPSIRVIAMSGTFVGASVPSGVAADAFYPKASCSVARIIDLCAGMQDGLPSNLNRQNVPVWLPETSPNSEEGAKVVVPCSECLRTFSCDSGASQSTRVEGRCPHCSHVIEFAIVETDRAVDMTGFALSPR